MSSGRCLPWYPLTNVHHAELLRLLKSVNTALLEELTLEHLFLKGFILFYVCMFCFCSVFGVVVGLHVCVCTMRMPSVLSGQKRGLDPLELESWWLWATMCKSKSSQCSRQQSHFCSPETSLASLAWRKHILPSSYGWYTLAQKPSAFLLQNIPELKSCITVCLHLCVYNWM